MLNLPFELIRSVNPNIILEYVGSVKYIASGERFERIIAGNKIPDAQRKSWNRDYGFRHLEAMKGKFSGSQGFVDFRGKGRCLNPFEWDAIQVALLGVEPEHRKKGVGRCLMGAVENVARARGAKKVYGYIDEEFGLSDPSGFYRKIGYNISSYTFCKVL